MALCSYCKQRQVTTWYEEGGSSCTECMDKVPPPYTGPRGITTTRMEQFSERGFRQLFSVQTKQGIG